MMRLVALALFFCLVVPVCAKPDWATIEGYVPDNTLGVLTLKIDKEGRDTFLAMLPVTLEVVNKVLDEQFGAFAKLTGVNPLEATELFACLAPSPKGDPVVVVGLKVAVDGAKVAAALKASPLGGQGFSVAEGDHGVLLSRGETAWAFVSKGVILLGQPQNLAGILARKGQPSPTNKDLIETCKAQAADASRLFLRLKVLEGSLPKLPGNLPFQKYGLPQNLPSQIAHVMINTTPSEVSAQVEFKDGAITPKVESAAREWLKDQKTELSNAVTKADSDAGQWGVLAPLTPDLMSAKMSLASYDDLSEALKLEASGSKITAKMPTEKLAPFKGTGGLALLGVLGGALMPKIKGALEPKMPVAGPDPGAGPVR
ncbi:MAG: hypothetical protein HY815_06900 [Candidatus Riflebacteria bacterium]|nr:hypothetical protein [Candidatus Riflebacteria bacterium]